MLRRWVGREAVRTCSGVGLGVFEDGVDVESGVDADDGGSPSELVVSVRVASP